MVKQTLKQFFLCDEVLIFFGALHPLKCYLINFCTIDRQNYGNSRFTIFGHFKDQTVDPQNIIRMVGCGLMLTSGLRYSR